MHTHQVVNIFHLLGVGGGVSSDKSSKILFCVSLEEEPGPCPKAAPALFLHPLPSLISSCSNLLFQILKDDAVKVLHSICQQICKTQQWPQDWQRSVFIPIPKKDNAKECSNYHTIALISHTSKVMLKIQRTWTMNFQMFKLDFKKAEELEIKLPISVGSLRK